MSAKNTDVIEVCFRIGDLIFTVRPDLWLHVSDKDVRQENVFGKKAFEALLIAVGENYFTAIEPSTEWFGWRDSTDAIYVEYYCRRGALRESRVIIHAGGGYRLHLAFSEFEMLLAKLRELLIGDNADILRLLEVRGKP